MLAWRRTLPANRGLAQVVEKRSDPVGQLRGFDRQRRFCDSQPHRNFRIWSQDFSYFPVDLPLDDEPSAESLEAVDDDEPDPEQVAPDRDVLSNEEYTAALEEVETRRRTFVYRKAVRSHLSDALFVH